TRRIDPDDDLHPVPVTADLEIEDKILGPFTARQAAYLASAALMLWLGYSALKHLVPLPILALAALVLGGALTVAVTTTRDGLTLDRYLHAALRHHRTPRRRVTTTGADTVLGEGLAPLDLPVGDLLEPGVLDLGEHGAAALVECGTVNLALRSGTEAGAVLGAFARALNALNGPFQFTVTAHRVDLTVVAGHCEQTAAGLPHPLLEARAREHAAFLHQLADSTELTARRVLLVVREPGPLPTAAVTVAHRAAQAAHLLAACGIDTRVLDAGQAAAGITAACDPRRDRHPARLAPPASPVRLATHHSTQEEGELPWG
ncbi:PrgI family protein, partial [Actinocrinis puniceicyclus]